MNDVIIGLVLFSMVVGSPITAFYIPGIRPHTFMEGEEVSGAFHKNIFSWFNAVTMMFGIFKIFNGFRYLSRSTH